MEVNEYLIPSEIEKFQFFQLTEYLYRYKGIDIDSLLKLAPKADPLRFVGDASLSFVTRDITAITIAKEKIQVKIPFNNLLGAHSPLPSYYLDDLVWEDLQEDPRVVTLLNLFNHRLNVFLYKIWRKYRYFISFKHNGEDEVSQRMFALVGLGSKRIRDLLLVNQSKMLSYAGILANSSRSPQLISALISHCFELSSVKIQSWQFRRVEIPAQQQNKIGKKNNILGKNFIVGSHMPNYTGKFILTIGDLSFKEMERFLPTGSLYHSLINFVSFILRDQLAWDLQLILSNNQASSMKLGTDTSCYLGWTTFLGQPPNNPCALLTIQE